MNLKEKLIEQGISLVRLAESISLSRPTLYKYLDITEREGMINNFKQIDSYE